MFFKFVILFTFFVDTNIQHYFEFANYFKDIFNLFFKVLITKEKKTAANTQLAK
jgi:hypothetical protein